MSTNFDIVSPIDSQILTTRAAASNEQMLKTVSQAVVAQASWQSWPVDKRAALLENAIAHFEQNKLLLAKEITTLMGRPIRYTAGEIDGLALRARYMLEAAPEALKDIEIPLTSTGSKRFIRKEPLGVVFSIAPWNYPYLTAVNSVIPALMAGNAVILKHSPQTLPVAEHFFQAFQSAGLPEHTFQFLHLDNSQTIELVQNSAVDFISFTGSVNGGQSIEKAAAGKFKHVALELGGKDPAYVRADADIIHSAEQIADGAFFNSGQSCCAVERVYVEQSVYQPFVEAIVGVAKQYNLGDPRQPETTLGPMVSIKAAQFVKEQIRQAVEQGATAHLDPADFPADKPDNAYVAPQILTDVDHSMSVMTEETFGPVVGIMPVTGDSHAIELMNDSQFGLTASIWTKDQQAAIDIGSKLKTGTVFMNRCDYLDPALAWSGVKQSGRGCALSTLGYTQLTRPKSFNLNE